jgi:uncharacterized protein DUF5989
MTMREVIRTNWRWFAIPVVVLVVLIGILLLLTERSSVAPFLYLLF